MQCISLGVWNQFQLFSVENKFIKECHGILSNLLGAEKPRLDYTKSLAWFILAPVLLKAGGLDYTGTDSAQHVLHSIALQSYCHVGAPSWNSLRLKPELKSLGRPTKRDSGFYGTGMWS